MPHQPDCRHHILEVQRIVQNTDRSAHRSNHRRRVCLAGACLLLVPALVGCQGAVTGHWHLVKAIPNREVFCFDNVQFERDGTFAATTTVEGLTTDERGTYRFNGFRITLRPQGGGQRAYQAILKTNQLEIIDGHRKVILKKGPRGG